jgi:hypothetical protein
MASMARIQLVALSTPRLREAGKSRSRDMMHLLRSAGQTRQAAMRSARMPQALERAAIGL